MDWTRCVAIVTGASSGIGLEVSRALVERGARVAMVARTPGPLLAAATSLGDRAIAFPLDVTDRARLTALPAEVKARFGRLDLVVNNAGVNHRGAVRDRSAAELTAILETNLLAPVLLTHAALPLLEPGAVVVNVASLAGKVPIPHEAAYSASKAGLRAFSRALHVESHGSVRVCAVNPGPVATNFFGDDLSHVPDLVFSQPMSTAAQVAKVVLQAIDGDALEFDLPALSGKLATLAYLSPSLYGALKPRLEKRGARNKAKYLAIKQGAKQK